MSAPLIVGALSMPVLLVWAALLMRAMLGIVGRARAASGAALPMPSATIPALRHWMRAPEHRAERRRLAALSVLLVAMQALTLAVVL